MHDIINDFSIGIFSVNGTGSQSANNLLAKTFMRMGLNVAPKNHFPSNIQGVPTSYEIRLSPKGFLCAKEIFDILILMNPDTFQADLKRLTKGTVLFYNEAPEMKLSDTLANTSGSFIYPVPVDELADKNFSGGRNKTLMKNMIILGSLMESLSVDEATANQVVDDTFADKAAVRESNRKALAVGRDYFRTHLKKTDPYRCQSQTANKNNVMLDGNQACALGALMGGCTVAAWYPITPSSSMMETLEEYFADYRTGANQKQRAAIIQCEDEISSIGVVVGAGYAGARSLTATSGPGISLMSEIASLAYYAETPSVIVDVQRVGPSTGLPTRTQQGDLLKAAFLGHGDTKHPMLFPQDPGEAYEMTMAALDYADRFQTLIFVMTDLDIGMNIWMTDAPQYPTRPFDRGKVLSPEDLDRLKSYGRYRDVDGDGIPYRTIPGNPHPLAAYFLRGTSHDENAKYTEAPEVYERTMARLRKKWETIARTLPKPVMEVNRRAEYGIIGIGSSHYAILEAVDHYGAKGLPLDYMRIKAFPFADEVRSFINAHKHVLVVDQNHDGQLKSLLQLSLSDLKAAFVPVCLSNGFPLSAHRLIAEIDKRLNRSAH